MRDGYYRLQISVYLEEVLENLPLGAYTEQSVEITALLEDITSLLDQNTLGRTVKQMAQNLIEKEETR